MRVSQWIAIALCLLVFACSSEDDSIPVRLSNGPPQWAPNYPTIASGAVSVDLNLSTDRPCNVHYVIADKDLGLSAREVISKSKQTESGFIRAAGVIPVTSADVLRKTLRLPFQDRAYVAYLVAQNTGDTLYLEEPVIARFTTASRQDTSEFFSAAEKRNVRYLIYRPEEALKYPDAAYAACVFVGGEDEVADQQSIKLIRNGTLPAVLHAGTDVNCIVLSPQHIEAAWNLQMVKEMISHAKATYPVDRRKLYLTGIGSGGFAAWEYAKANPDEIAAIVPISSPAVNTDACNLRNVAVFSIHNEVDYVVPSEPGLKLLQALQSCTTTETRSLVLPDPGHNAWKRIYDIGHPDWNKSPGLTPFNIFDWMLGFSKN